MFYRDTSSLSHEASTIRWAEGLQGNPALYLAQGNTLGAGAFAVTGDSTKGTALGVPLGYRTFMQLPTVTWMQARVLVSVKMEKVFVATIDYRNPVMLLTSAVEDLHMKLNMLKTWMVSLIFKLVELVFPTKPILSIKFMLPVLL